MSEISTVGWTHNKWYACFSACCKNNLQRQVYFGFQFFGSKLSTFNCYICWYFAFYFQQWWF